MHGQTKQKPLNGDSKAWLRAQFGGRVKFDEPMSAHTSFKVGGPAEAYIEPKTKNELITLIKWSRKTGHAYLVIGGGTNLLVRDGGLAGLAINLRRCLKKISVIETEPHNRVVTAMAGARLSALCSFAIKNGLKGMNFALGIPGSIGGAVMMNAGTSSGWMEDILKTVWVLWPDGTTETISREKLDFSYRRLSWKKGNVKFNAGRPIITEAAFVLFPSDPEALKAEAEALLETRRKGQPTSKPSAGCFFKNPPSGNTAGELIDLAGLKGTVVGGAAVSSKHANFIVNRRQATAADIIELMTRIQQVVREQFQVHLEPEVQIVGH